jgi:3-oxoacyl-[acyl-carrier-protein] synthase II
VGDAYRFIKYGDAEVMLAGGTEAGVTPISLALFSRIHALSRNEDPLTASRPFDSQRDGFVMGEGAAVLLLEALDHAQQRGARIYAEVVGYGLSGDAHHVTSPPEQGRGALASMTHALRSAGLGPADLDYVNAHATSTPLGDAVECRALQQLLVGEARRVRVSGTKVSSTKGAVGHMLGAAGAFEALVCALVVARDVVPPTLALQQPDEEALTLGLDLVPLTAQRTRVSVAMSNSFGFGGTNTSLVVKMWEGR